MTNCTENEQWVKKLQKNISDWLTIHESNALQWIDENNDFLRNQILEWKKNNKTAMDIFKNNIQENFQNWLDNNFETDISIANHVFYKLENFYLSHRNHKRNCIPHYYNWDKPNYGIPFPIFKKSPNNSLHFQPELKDIHYYVKQHAKQVYEKEFYELSENTQHKTYYSLLTEILCDSPEMLLLDISIDYRCNKKQKSENFIRLYCDHNTIIEKTQNIEKPCNWISRKNLRITYGELKKITTYDFTAFAQQRIKKENISFPYSFKYSATNDELILGENYKEIQRELIYNDKLRNYFKTDFLSDDKAFFYEEACKRIKKMYPEPSEFASYSISEQEEYVYIIEKITGINLAYCYTQYYSQIKKILLDREISKERTEALLLWVLDEFIDFPNVLTRTQIVKEFMEPLLFLDENIEEKLCHIKEETRQLKIYLNLKWKAIYSSDDIDTICKNVVAMDFDIDDLIKYNKKDVFPVIFAKYICKNKIVTTDFAIVFRHILKKINLNNIINSKILQIFN